MNIRSTVCACLALLFAATIGHAQTAPPPPAPPPASDTGTTITLPSVQTLYAPLGSRLLVDGRIFAGIYDTQDNGAYPHDSLLIPDAKLRFTYIPSQNLTVVTRLSFAAPSAVSFDYLYADLNNWGGLIPGQMLRFGRMKVDFGEETWTNNQEEDNLISNSAANATGYDEGLDFRGPIVKGAHPIIYSVSLLNGTTLANAVGAPESVVKIGASPINHLYVSASYLDTGKIPTADSSAFSVAGLANFAPHGATTWRSHAGEVDARWNFGSTGMQPNIPTGPTAAVPFQLAAAYGQFTDDPNVNAELQGNYWYGEALYNISQKFYVAARYSNTSLDNGATATLNSVVTANKFNRSSLGIGYRLTSLTVLKAEYSVNKAATLPNTDPHLNQFAIGVATKF